MLMMMARIVDVYPRYASILVAVTYIERRRDVSRFQSEHQRPNGERLQHALITVSNGKQN